MAHAALVGVVGSSCPDTSTPHVGARLAALGLGRIDARTYATAHEWHLLFGRHLCPVALVRKRTKPRCYSARLSGSGTSLTTGARMLVVGQQ
jgi:hypothetical protein